MVDLVKVMILFNVRVELGQLAIILVAFPLLFLIRRQPWFVPFVVRSGSAAIVGAAPYWLPERTFA